MAQYYTICLKWPSHAIGWSRQGTNSIRDAKWCVCVSKESLIRHKDSQRRHTSLMLTLSRKWRSIRSLHQHSCVWNANPTKSQALHASYALSWSPLLYVLCNASTWVSLCEEVLFLVQGSFFLSICLNPCSSLHLGRCLRPWDRGPIRFKSSTCDYPYPCC